MKNFRIHCDQQVIVWQHNVHDIEAETKEEAIEKLKKESTRYCVDTETLFETEEVIQTDFETNFEIEET
jgi:hypothetical protein